MQYCRKLLERWWSWRTPFWPELKTIWPLGYKSDCRRSEQALPLKTGTRSRHSINCLSKNFAEKFVFQSPLFHSSCERILKCLCWCWRIMTRNSVWSLVPYFLSVTHFFAFFLTPIPLSLFDLQSLGITIVWFITEGKWLILWRPNLITFSLFYLELLTDLQLPSGA